MIEFTLPTGKAGSAMGKCTEAALLSLKDSLEKHYSGTERLWPEDVMLCEQMCHDIWQEIYRLRNQASFLLSDMVENNSELTVTEGNPLAVISRNAVILELIDKDVGKKTGGFVEVVWEFVWNDPMLEKIPHRRTRVYH